MPKQFDNTNRWTLFRNENKNKETDCDYSGTVNIDGQEFWLNGWLKESKEGKKFFSGTVKAKTAAKPAGKYLAQVNKAADDFDDGSGIPF